MIQDISLYWNSKEEKASFISGSTYTDEQKIAFLKDKILRRGHVNQDIQPILFISLESCLVMKNLNKPNSENEPRYKLEIDLKPINLDLNNKQVGQMVSLVEAHMALIGESKRRQKLSEISEEERQEDVILFMKAMTDLLLSIEEADFVWQKVLENPVKKAQADVIKGLLAKIPNDVVTSVSREIVLRDEKRRLMSHMEKKIVKKGGFMSFWKDDSTVKKDNEELAKIGDFFDAFIEENVDKIGNSLMKGFIFEVGLKLSEASILLMNIKSSQKQGVLAMIKSPRFRFQFHQNEGHDFMKFDFSLQDIQMSLQEKGLMGKASREVMIMTKYNQFDVHDLISFNLKTTNYYQGKNIVDLQGNIGSTELRFIPELVTTLKRFFQLEKTQNTETLADYAYEKMSDISKNAQDHVKSLINESSSELIVSITWASTYILLPLVPHIGDDSDCWILSMNKAKAYTEPEIEDKVRIYDNMKIALDDISVSYVKSITAYQARKKEAAMVEDAENMFVPFVEKTKFALDLNMIRSRQATAEHAMMTLNLSVGEILVQVNQQLIKKAYELQNCFDFSREKDLAAYLETEKKKIMENNDGILRVYMKNASDLTNIWDDYVMVSSGFYLYFFNNANDVRPVRYVFTRHAKVEKESEEYDLPNILRIKNRSDEVLIAFKKEEALNKIAQTVQKKNDEYTALHLEIDKKIDIDQDVEQNNHNEARSKQIQFKASVQFDGLRMNLLNPEGVLLNQISIFNLNVEYEHRPLDIATKVQLAGITILDYTLDNDQPTILVASNVQRIDLPDSSTELIMVDIRIFNPKHPDFEKKMSEVDSSINFNTLFINYIPERVYALGHFFVVPISQISQVSKSTASEPQISLKASESISGFEKDAIGIQGKHFIAKKLENNKEVKFFTGSVQIKELSLTLFTQISHIKLAQTKLQQFQVDIDINKKAIAYKGSLKNIQLFDLTNYQQNLPDTNIVPYELVGVEGGSSLLRFEFTQREDAYMKELQTDVGKVLNVEINSIRVNYINQPFMRIMNYCINFLLDFAFAERLTYEEKRRQAVEKLQDPKFLNIHLTVNHLTVLLKAKPSHKTFYELSVNSISVNNKVGQNIKRLGDSTELKSVFIEDYKILVSEACLKKNSFDGVDLQISNRFSMDINFERCLFYDDYLLIHNIQQADKSKFLDDGFYISVLMTPVCFKITQEDYIDLMEVMFKNLAYEDRKDAMYHIELEDLPELKKVDEPTPISINMKLDYIAIIAIDQIANVPLAKIVAVSMGLDFQRKMDKDIKLTISKVVASYFERNMEKDHCYMEKTLLGHLYGEREVILDESQTIDHILSPEMIDQEIAALEGVRETLIKISYVMYANGNRDMVMGVSQVKLIMNLGAIMRLKDFLMPPEDDEKSDLEEVASGQTFRSKNHYKANIESAEVSLPVSDEATVIMKCKF